MYKTRTHTHIYVYVCITNVKVGKANSPKHNNNLKGCCPVDLVVALVDVSKCLQKFKKQKNKNKTLKRNLKEKLY